MLRMRVFALLAVLGLSGANAWADPAATTRFVPEDDRVLDRHTGLVWQRCSVGQRREADFGCVGLPQKLAYVDALALESTHWRLPTLDELQSLYRQDLSAPVDAVEFHDFVPTWYWARGPGDVGAVWGLACDGARRDMCARGANHAVRLVRREGAAAVLNRTGAR